MAKAAEKQRGNSKKKVVGRPFKPGQSGNPKGRPKKGFAISERIRASVTDEDWEEIIAKAKEQAKDGDKSARDFLVDRTEGKAPQTITQKNINIDHGDWDETEETAEQFLARELSQR
jgi:predicted ArsR family transcriptional regulator